MKAFTNLEQSKKLADILPIESADMWWPYYYDVVSDTGEYDKEPMLHKPICDPDKAIPCWSLAALLNIMPKHIKQNDGSTYKFHIFNDDGIVIQRWGCSYVAKDYHNRAEYLSDPKLKYPTNIYSGKYEDILDACVEMILKLNEQKIL